MNFYKFVAKNLDGETFNGEYIASNISELIITLREKNLFLIKSELINKNTKELFLNKLNEKELSLFCKELSLLLEAGIPISKALNVLSVQNSNKKLKKVLREIEIFIQQGEELSECMKKFNYLFPSFMINMIDVGEESGELSKILNDLSEYYMKQYKIKNRIISSMTYPLIVLVITIFISGFLIFKIVPMFVNTLDSIGGKLPLITRVIIGISNMFINNFLINTVVAIIFTVSLIIYYKSKDGKMFFDKAKFRAPFLKSIYCKITGARFSKSMAILLKSGVTVIDALEMTSKILENNFVEQKIKKAIFDIKEGKTISQTIKNINIFDYRFIMMIHIGEESGILDEMFNRSADIYEQEVENSINIITTFIEPIMIIFLSIIVGAVIFSIMLPMINIMDTLGN